MPCPHPYRSLAAVLTLSLLGAGCAESPTASPASDTPQAPPVSEQPINELNPQPEPPSLQLHFSMTPDGDAWFGTISVGGQACGAVQLNPQPEPPFPQQTGVVTHVAYALSIQGDNPDFLLDADLSGIVAGNHVVLNGVVSDGFYAGQTLHPRGSITLPPPDSPTDLQTTMTGIIQLNPQPEPPAPAEYPPSPCTG